MIAVLVIDMQNAYFEDPALKGRQEEIVAACNSLTSAASQAGAKVLLVGTVHERDKSTWSLNMLDDDQGFIFRGSEQAGFVPGLLTEDYPWLIKTRDSAFFGTDLAMRLRNWKVDTVILAGISAHNCIAQTAADAFAHNIKVVYAAEAIGTENADAAESVLRVFTREYRQSVLPLEGIRQLLGTVPSA
ncbi:cysteine hydrolase family protein [Paenarthrobacter aurescens]|uniref:Nicotinamidase n=1 Tax=Paenarthrobacter aurescens TaxID=43663 RepID=A0A4Y3NGI2_PAEAU|nr:isochorismatase family cysteine hydrolase [Paenarthrobacter aurescens]MDO6145387.1 cysteine hydrolase [Paenarthrobacter aurescens]MDO6149192.1 cysteine hydrolase [Paenarthrobacter aurescens]MDO6160436.1 cysteine hydrolase [Paenarthrobacter aurescens]MDO6164295.1 cysteine hydrolase [Paenarthrobacter aurescens]GEB19585.1 nicotinamidase [Paenarthrobacter aurescens]